MTGRCYGCVRRVKGEGFHAQWRGRQGGMFEIVDLGVAPCFVVALPACASIVAVMMKLVMCYLVEGISWKWRISMLVAAG